ncbi:MAG: hypothetical protein AAGA02_02300 [Bacteroidota bacterium]
MASLERDQLDYIRGNAIANKQIETLLQAKQKALKSLQNSRSIEHYKPQPKLTPSNDITINTPSKSEGLDPESYNQKFKEVIDHYNEKIAQSTKEYFSQEVNPDDLELLEQLDKEDLALLLEEDTEAVLNKQHEELTKEASAKEDREIGQDKDVFDVTMDEAQAREIFNDPDPHQEIQLHEEWEVEQGQNVDQEIYMDDAKSEGIFNGSTTIDDFSENSKDMDIDK